MEIFIKISTNNMIFQKMSPAVFLTHWRIFGNYHGHPKKGHEKKPLWILNNWIFHQIIDYLPRQNKKIRTYYYRNPVPVLSVSKTVRTRTRLRTTIWPWISSVNPYPYSIFKSNPYPSYLRTTKSKFPRPPYLLRLRT